MKTTEIQGMSFKRKITTGLLWAAAQTTTQQLVGLLTFSIMAGILGPKLYGLVAMGLVVVNLVAIILNQGLLEGLLQRPEIKPVDLDSMFYFVLLASLALAAGMFATADWIARLYGQPELIEIQRALSLVPMLIAAAAIPTVLVRRELRFRTFAARTIIAEVVGAIVGIGMAVLGFGAWAIIGNLLVLHALNVLVLWMSTRWRPGLRFSWHELRSLLGYGLQVISIRGLNFLDNQGPRFLVGYGIGPLGLGYLHFAGMVLRFINQLFISPFNVIGVPAVARLQNDPAKIDRLLLTATRMASLLIYPAFIGIAAIAPVLVPLVFGSEWAPAVPVLQIMTIGGLAKIYLDMYDATLRGLGKPHWVIITRAIQALLSVVLAVAAVKYGVIAIATILAVKGLLFLPLNVWILQRAGGPRLGPILAANLPTLLAAALMGACVFVWIEVMRSELNSWALLGTSIAIGIASYAALVLALVRSAVRDALSLLRSVRVPAVQASGK